MTKPTASSAETVFIPIECRARHRPDGAAAGGGDRADEANTFETGLTPLAASHEGTLDPDRGALLDRQGRGELFVAEHCGVR